MTFSIVSQTQHEIQEINLDVILRSEFTGAQLNLESLHLNKYWVLAAGILFLRTKLNINGLDFYKYLDILR